MNNKLQLYFDFLQNLTEIQKFKIKTLFNKQSTSSSKKLLTKLLIKYYKLNNPTSSNILPNKLINIIRTILGIQSQYKCKLFIEKIKKQFIWEKRWSKNEDNKLLQLCQNEPINWINISNLFNSQNIINIQHRQSNMIKARWENKINPKILKTQWTKDDDELLLNFVLKHGKQWERIKRILLFHRSTDQIIERFYQLLEQNEKLPRINIKSEYSDIQIHSRYQLDDDEISIIKSILQSKKIEKTISISKKSKKIDSSNQKDKMIINIKKIIEEVKQDDNVNFEIIKEHFVKVENTIDNQKDEEIQFGIQNGDSKEIFLFPNQQLKAILKLMYKMKEQKEYSKEEEKNQFQKIDESQQKLQNDEYLNLHSYYRRQDIQQQQSQTYQQQIMFNQYAEQQKIYQQQQYQQIYQQQNMSMLQYQGMYINQFTIQQLFQQYQAQVLQQSFLKNQCFDQNQIKKEHNDK